MAGSVKEFVRLLFVLIMVSFVSSSVIRTRMCSQFRRCFFMSPLCRMLFRYYRCTDLRGFGVNEPTCGISGVTSRIVNGTQAAEGEFPWTVYLSVGCGGTVVDKHTVLTAAHCVIRLVNTPSALIIGYGSVNRTEQATIPAKRIIMHPLYNSSNKDNDIAIVKLSRPLPMDGTTSLRSLSICLPRPATSYLPDRNCIIAGWGQLEDGGFILPIRLRKATVPLVHRELCQILYSGNDNIFVSERQLCAGYVDTGGVDSCQGDSGGPLFCLDGSRWVLEGIVSRGGRCAAPFSPGVYTFVPQYFTWITCLMGDI